MPGAPSTGRTYLAKQIASWLILKIIFDELTNEDKNKITTHYKFVQFHPSYDYTDFVEGLRPTPPDDNGNIGFMR